MSENFWCRKSCGDYDPPKGSTTGFSIEEWNKRMRLSIELGLSEADTRKMLDEEHCETQCPECACRVGDQRLKTQELIRKMKKK